MIRAILTVLEKSFNVLNKEYVYDFGKEDYYYYIKEQKWRKWETLILPLKLDSYHCTGFMPNVLLRNISSIWVLQF